MRIIAGIAGGRILRAPSGTSTRPTSDRVREAVLNVLVARGPVPAEVLDLYAGSGALGLEALSRGAERAIFVEQDEAVVQVLEANARTLGFGGRCQVACMPVHRWLRRAPAGRRFGWVFLDPPYAAQERGELDRALRLLEGAAVLDKDAVVAVEHDWRRAPADRHGELALSDRRRYGQSAVSFYSREESP